MFIVVHDLPSIWIYLVFIFQIQIVQIQLAHYRSGHLVHELQRLSSQIQTLKFKLRNSDLNSQDTKDEQSSLN